MEDPAARHTTVSSSDGTATRIKSQGGLGLFWRRRAPIPGDSWHWVLTDSSDDNDDHRNTLFQPFQLESVHSGETRVGLLSLGNDMFCKRFTVSNILVHDLAAMDKDTAAAEPQLRMQEPVVSREIDVFQYSLTQARVYDEEELILATAHATNDTSSPAIVELAFEIALTEKRRWSSSVTLRSPVVTTTISSPVIPSMSEVDDDHSCGVVAGLSSFYGMYSWGATNIKTSREIVVKFVGLPPMTNVTATCLAKTSSYDVPFSYRQTDTLIGGGEELNLEFQDGIYSGQNFHSLVYKYETENITT